MSLLNEKLESNNLDSSELPDLGLNFEHNVACGITVPGTVEIQDGSISGLANFCRNGDSELKINVRPYDDSLTIYFFFFKFCCNIIHTGLKQSNDFSTGSNRNTKHQRRILRKGHVNLFRSRNQNHGRVDRYFAGY